jgi:peptidoglycan/xylan/chitin deacetylase (PgdA/CDA1 family)
MFRPVVTSLAAAGALLALGSGLALAASCPSNPDGLGVSRTVEIDTTGGPAFGMEHYKVHDFLQPREVILTFDDGPQKIHTELVLAALAQQCTRATFFSIGKMALGHPELLRDILKQGHTVGTHTWSHADLRAKKTDNEALDEIERGISAVRRAAGGPIAPFFRYPYLRDSKATVDHLASRNIAIFSTDIDSFDFKFRSPEQLAKVVIDKLEKRGKGMVLLHDIQPGTAKAVPLLLAELKTRGFKIVHMKAKGEVKTIAEYDQLIEKDVRGLAAPGSERPTSAVVRTVDEQPAAAGAAKAAATPAKKP